jgi:hypothetical protein
MVSGMMRQRCLSEPAHFALTFNLFYLRGMKLVRNLHTCSKRGYRCCKGKFHLSLIIFRKFHELSLAQSRNFMKISSKVGLVAAEAYLHHLDLSNNTLNYIACKLLASMIKNTTNLQLLNMSNCGLRNTSSREIANALLFN